MTRTPPIALRLAGIFLIYCAWSTSCGWLLSWCHHLDLSGYCATVPPFGALAFWWWTQTRPTPALKLHWRPVLHRMRHSPAFSAWLTVSILIFVGGILHAPANHDGLCYRIPRVCYWLQGKGWFWIDGQDFRMDLAGAGFEWMSVPLILATGSDRILFLLNYLPFLLLPGLFYVSASGLGISPRSARWWMWIWPLAYGVALQAGSIGNDLACVTLSLMSLAFAAESRRGLPIMNLFFSALAAILMSGIKHTTLPLGLPLMIFWCYSAWSAIRVRRLVLLGAALVPFALLCGFLPISYLSWQHTGAWNGNPANRLGQEAGDPIAGVVGNGLNFTKGALYPPILPGAAKAGMLANEFLESLRWFRWVKNHYPSSTFEITQELPSEEQAGVGLAVAILLLIWFLKSYRKRTALSCNRLNPAVLYAYATVLAFLVFLAKLGVGGAPRLALPFTPHLVLAAIFLSGYLRDVPSKWWGLLPALFLLPTLLLNPNRPLIPPSALNALPGIPAGVRSRLDIVYSTYAHRNRLLAPFLPYLPDGATIGFGGSSGHPSTSLFFPLGRIKVVDLAPESEQNANWIVGTQKSIEQRMKVPLDDWAKDRFELVHHEELVDKVVMGREAWLLFRRIQSH